jgi:hypothetical protein
MEEAQVKHELIGRPRVDHKRLRKRIRVQVRSRLVEKLPRKRNPLAVHVMDDGKNRDVRDPVRRAGR